MGAFWDFAPQDDSATYGHVCGGNNAHTGNQSPLGAWNTAATPSSGNTYTAGDSVAVQIIQQTEHAASDSSRGSYYTLDYAPTSTPAHEDFIPIADVASPTGSTVGLTYNWDTTGVAPFTAGVFRVIYHTGLEAPATNPMSAGVSSVYVQCADIRVN